EPRLRDWFSDRDTIIVGHNAPFDLAVVCERFPHLRPMIFRAIDENRVEDTQVRQWLLDTAAGALRGRVGPKGQWIQHEYTLEALAKRAANIVLQKDGWRLSYGEFIDVPLDRWIEHAKTVQAKAVDRLR